MACLQGLHTLCLHNFGHNDVVGASNIMPAEWAFFHHKENDNNNKSQVWAELRKKTGSHQHLGSTSGNLLSYIINWTLQELAKLHTKTIKFLTMYKMHHLKSDVDRLYLPILKEVEGSYNWSFPTSHPLSVLINTSRRRRTLSSTLSKTLTTGNPCTPSTGSQWSSVGNWECPQYQLQRMRRTPPMPAEQRRRPNTRVANSSGPKWESKAH